MNGKVYKWTNGGLKSVHQVHNGIVYCIKYLENGYMQKPCLFSGGSDKIIYILSPSSMLPMTSLLFDGVPKSVDFSKFLLVGLRNGHIVECDIEKNAKETIMHSHHDGEVWALAVIEEQGMIVTAADDNKLLMFDIAKRKCVQRGQVTVGAELEQAMEASRKKAAPKRGGASTMSIEPPEN